MNWHQVMFDLGSYDVIITHYQKGKSILDLFCLTNSKVLINIFWDQKTLTIVVKFLLVRAKNTFASFL